MPTLMLRLALLLAGACAPAAAQQEPPVPVQPAGAALPAAVAGPVVRFFNDTRNVRLVGPATVAATDTVRAGVAALEGPLVVEGRVEGSVVLVNGLLRLRPGASVAGDVTVVGGVVEGVDSARVEGEIRTYPAPLRYRREGGRIVAEEEDRGRGDFLVATGKSYNRVEGLPVTFGPRIRTSGRNPLRVHALAIYRTEAGLTLDPDELGYFARVEQFLGGRRAARLGLAAHSVVDPIEDWQLSDLENGLATFLFHRDFRDHYEREGLAAFAAWSPGAGPLQLEVEGRWERHGSLAAGNPWSLVDNGDPWRPQPLVAEGRVGTVLLGATLDTRSDATDPSTGWYLRGRVEQALHSDLRRPAMTGEGSALVDPRDPLRAPHHFGRFSVGTVDLRRYNRVDPTSRLNFRLLASSSLDRSPLPPQRQHALGGEGSLPGYPLFRFDCGARDDAVHRLAAVRDDASPAVFFPRYGCDGVALLQAEYRGKFSFRFRWDSAPWRATDDEDEGFGLDLAPDWTLFVDAGRAWSYGSAPDEQIAADVGLGVLVNRLGLFFAVPLSGDEGMNLFVRVGPRF